MTPLQNTRVANDVDGWLEVVTFDLGGETFAIEALMVQEILDLLPETPVPGAPAFAPAVANFRGKVIPIADLRVAFGMPAAASTIDSRIMVIEIGVDGEALLIGLRTDKVYEVAQLRLCDGESPPSVGMSWRPDFIRSLVERDGQFLVLPDLGQIFEHMGRAGARPALAGARR